MVPPPPPPPPRLLAYISRSPPSAQVANSHKVLLFRRPLPLSLCLLLYFRIPVACTACTVPAGAEPLEPRPPAEDPAWYRQAIRFLGSIITRLLAHVRLLPLRQLRMNDYFVYSGSSLRSSVCIDLVRLHRLRSLTMSDIGKSGDAVTLPSTRYFLKLVFMFISLPSTRYFLKLVFMFISCMIMNIFMFNCCLNINNCTWIVSLTAILKCLFHYGIKIYQNIFYHLTVQCWKG
jgi:hypothetical protein